MKNMIASVKIPSVSISNEELITLQGLFNDPMIVQILQTRGISPETLSSLGVMLGSLGSLSSMAGYMSQLTAGLEQAVDALMLIANQVSVGLSSMTDIDTSAITELQTGMAELASQYGQFNEGLKTYTDGVAALADGAGSFSSGMYTLNSETSSIPDILNEFLGEDEEAEETGPVSFLSDENEETASVQFVLSTEGNRRPRGRGPRGARARGQGLLRRALGQDSRPLHLINTPDMINPPSIPDGGFSRLRSGLHVAHVHGADVRVGRLAYLQLEAVEVLEHIAELAEAVGARVEVGLLLDNEVARFDISIQPSSSARSATESAIRLMISSGTGGFSLAAGADFFAADLAGAFSAFSGVLEAVFFAGAFFAAGFAVFLYLSRMTSTRMNLSQAWTKALGVFSSPIPMTYIPLSRRRMARGVKSLSELTRT